MKKKGFVFVLKLLLMIFVLLSTFHTESALAASPNCTKTFSISSSSDFTKKATISNLVVNVNQVFSIYFYATNGGNAQCPPVLQDIPLTVTLIDPNNHATSYNNISIPKGPANTYGMLPNISCNLIGKWKVKVSGDPGKGNVIVTDTFTVVGNLASLNVTPPEATIQIGSTQKFEASFTDSQGNTTPISNVPTEGSIPDAFNYALFSGSSTSALTLQGSYLNINGSSHSNNSFTANASNLDLTGTCEAVKAVSINTSSKTIGKIVQNAPSLVMPDVDDAIIAMAKSTGQTFNGNKSYNDSSVKLDTPIYVDGNLAINCSEFNAIGPIVATGDITINVSNLKIKNNAPVSIYSKNGKITINCSSEDLIGMVYAPNGTITMNGSYLSIYGRVVGNAIAIYCSSLFIDCSGNDLSSLVSGGEPQVLWTSSDINVATIDASGLATSTGAGTCVITAKYTLNNVLYTDTATLTVALPTLEITPASVTIPSGYTQQFQAFRTDFDGDPNDVTQSVIWSISCSGYPYLATASIDKSGLAYGRGVGSFTITAKDPSSGISCTATLTIEKPTMSINPPVTNLVSGSTQQYYAILSYAGLSKCLTDSVIWSSNNHDVATINDLGLVTGIAPGTCKITGTDGISGEEGSLTLTVTAQAPTQLRLTLANTEPLIIGGDVQVTAVLVYPDNTTKDVTDSITWQTSNPNVATVDTGKVTGQGGGQCSIIATDPDSGLSRNVTIAVRPALILTPPSRTIPIGFKQQYTAQLVYADGTAPQDVTDMVAWSSSNSGIAEITGSGLATAKAEGSCTVTALDNSGSGSQGSSELTVENVTALTITPHIDAIFVGDKQQFNLQSDVLTSSAAWKSSDPSIAKMEDKGLVVGNKPGTSTITVTITINGKSLTGSFLLTVLPSKGGIIREWEQ